MDPEHLSAIEDHYRKNGSLPKSMVRVLIEDCWQHVTQSDASRRLADESVLGRELRRITDDG